MGWSIILVCVSGFKAGVRRGSTKSSGICSGAENWMNLWVSWFSFFFMCSLIGCNLKVEFVFLLVLLSCILSLQLMCSCPIILWLQWNHIWWIDWNLGLNCFLWWHVSWFLNHQIMCTPMSDFSTQKSCFEFSIRVSKHPIKFFLCVKLCGSFASYKMSSFSLKVLAIFSWFVWYFSALKPCDRG